MPATMNTMFNPLEKFDKRLIGALRNKDERYIVSQSYPPGIDHLREPGKDSLLLTPYANPEQAAVHLQMIGSDRYKALIDLENEKHRNKVVEIVQPTSKYIVYSSFIADRKAVERKANHRYKKPIFRFIRNNTSWIIPQHEVLEPHLSLLYGEFIVSIERFDERIQIKLTDLENA